MKNVGVISSFRLPVANSYLKRYAFFFDEFLVTGTRQNLLSKQNERFYSNEVLQELEYLFDCGIIKDGTVKPGDLAALPSELAESYRRQTGDFFNAALNNALNPSVTDQMSVLMDRIRAAKQSGTDPAGLITEYNVLVREEAERLVDSTRIFEEAARLLALDQRAFHNTNAVCLENLGFSTNVDRTAQKSELYEIVIDGIAIPDELIPWQDIIDFRNEDESKKRLLDLHLWISDLATGKVSYVEAANRVQSLKERYRDSMKIAKMKFKTGIVRTIVVGLFALIENTLKLKLKEIADAPFNIVNGRAELMEREMDAPGRQLSYLVRLEDRF